MLIYQQARLVTLLLSNEEMNSVLYLADLLHTLLHSEQESVNACLLRSCQVPDCAVCSLWGSVSQVNLDIFMHILHLE